MPELRLVVLALQDRLAYGPNFEAALSFALRIGDTVSDGRRSRSNPPTGAAAPAGAAQPSANLNELVRQASSDFADYQRLTSEGKLAEAGQKLDDLKRVLNELSTRAK